MHMAGWHPFSQPLCLLDSACVCFLSLAPSCSSRQSWGEFQQEQESARVDCSTAERSWQGHEGSRGGETAALRCEKPAARPSPSKLSSLCLSGWGGKIFVTLMPQKKCLLYFFLVKGEAAVPLAVLTLFLCDIRALGPP